MYNGQCFNVFLSYRGNGDSGILGSTIYSDLLHYKNKDNEAEFIPFFAPACIPKGEDFKQAIKNVLEDIKCFVMILDHGFFDGCATDDDIVYFELKTALAKKSVRFITIIMNNYAFSSDSQLYNLFDSSEIDRFKHINAINYHGIYDFKTEFDLVPVLLSSLKDSFETSISSDNVVFNVSEYKVEPDKTIMFGKYPQTVVNDIDLIDKIATGVFTGETIADKTTNWLCYNNNYYATLAENPFNKTKFDNGRAINSGARNYYLVEAIKWQVLFSNEQYYVLISEKLIDAVQFNLNRLNHRIDENSIAANNWEYSYIRRWLNNEFIYDAFTKQQIESIIMLSEIDNSAKSSYYNLQTVKNTFDKVFLISHSEIFLTKYGCAKTTDYARARGAYSSTSASHCGHGDWWTRSQGNQVASIENIDRRGNINAVPFCNYVDDTAAAVRPVIIVRKDLV